MAYLIAKEQKSHGCLEVKKPAYYQVCLIALSYKNLFNLSDFLVL